jgi:RimJ/RimL family protein N-acetyltransferase
MQKSWRLDYDKLTFIATLPASALQHSPTSEVVAVSPIPDEIDRMIGDVNLFLVEDEEDEARERSSIIGEVEIMIAREDLQGKGYGKAALLVFLWYIVRNQESIVQEYAKGVQLQAGLVLRHLRVKIDMNNTRSIKLFEGVGFRKISEKPNYFDELELRWDFDSETTQRLLQQADDSNYKEGQYMLDSKNNILHRPI